MHPKLSQIQDRAAGCIVGAFVGDALGLGPHWYYDLAEQHRDFGPWIDGYTDPKPDRPYHKGMKAGDLSHSGLIMLELLRSLAKNQAYDEVDFTNRLDQNILPDLDGTPFYGPGGFINHSIRQVWQARVKERRPWDDVAGNADTSESAERAALIAACLASTAGEAASAAFRNSRLTQDDSLVLQQSVAFACVVAAIVRGEPLDEDLSDKLMARVKSGEIPFTASTSLAASGDTTNFGFASPDALLLPSWVAETAHDPDIRIEPAWKVSILYGMSCASNYVIPAAYYLAVRFGNDFEAAVLHALNGGGQNMSRACLTGALVGARIGLSNIPTRFVEGLNQGQEISQLAVEAAKRLG